MKKFVPHFTTFSKIIEQEGSFYLAWKHNDIRIDASKSSNRPRLTRWAIRNEKRLFEEAVENIILGEQ